MGRKGVSKRKSKQNSNKAQAGSNAGNQVSAALHSEETPLVKSMDPGKADHGSNRKQKKG